ncbi:MAG: nucleoside hydrolase [Pseudomonadota bacterium]
MRRVIIDCDPGLDDAVALLAAFGAADIDVLAVTTVAGNVTGPQTALNAQIIREAAGLDSRVPIHAGAPRPMVRDPVTAEDFHGTTGLGDIDFPAPRFDQSEAHAVEMIVRSCRSAKNAPITMIVTGPMTNLALALDDSPDVVDGIAEIVLMGGADKEGGNITPYAEFNVYADPHAAATVFESGIPIRCLSLDVTHFVRATAERIKAVRGVETTQAAIAGDLLQASSSLEFSAKGHRDAPLHDPSTIIAVTRPDLFKGRYARVEVVTEPGQHIGRTIPHFCEDGHVLWYEEADDEGVFDELCRLLGEYE